MGITASSQHDRVFDLGTLLHDAAVKTASFAGEIATVAKVIDFGGVTAQGVVNVAYTRFDFVVDVRAADSGTGDEQYLFVLQLSNDTNGNGTLFEAADAVVNKVVIPVGDALSAGAGNSDDMYTVGRYAVSADNEVAGTLYRYARLYAILAGTTPSVTAYVYLTEVAD